jgi:hypothetical protein
MRRASQQTDRAAEVALPDQLRGAFDLPAPVLQPELRRLVHGLEEQLVAVRHLLRCPLQRQQFVGAQVALVVAAAVPRKDRL